MAVVVPSSKIYLNLFQLSVALYLETVPLGTTYSVPFEYALLSKVFSFMTNGFLIFDVTDIRLLQSLKAASPMIVTLLGIVIEVRLEQP